MFLPFIRKTAPGLLVLGPGSVGEGGLLANYAGIKSEAMLETSGGGVDVFSYHSYNAVSQRCAGLGGGGNAPGQTTPDAALTADWLSRAERDARFYIALRDRFANGKPVWLTESGETACGGNPWASTFTDTFRYVEQLGRLARLGVRVVMHNTLAASDYALVDEESLEPRPELLGGAAVAAADGHHRARRRLIPGAERRPVRALPRGEARWRGTRRRQRRYEAPRRR